jgi:hypothetical protein
MLNPFSQNLPIELTMLPSRKKNINEIVEDINYGRSMMIVSEPRMGCSAIFSYLFATENRISLYGSSGKKLLFGIVNCRTLSFPFNQAEFWKLAFQSFKESNTFEKDVPTPWLFDFTTSKQIDFFAAENIIKNLKKLGYFPILFLNDFDSIFSNQAPYELTNDLRSLSGSGLQYVILSYNPALGYDKLGPLTNTLGTYRLVSLSNRDITMVLNHEEASFLPSDRSYINSVAGGHPYLLRVTAEALWIENKRNIDQKSRYVNAGKKVYSETQFHFSEIWSLWGVEKRKVISAIALMQTPYILKNHAFSSQDFAKELSKFSPELHDLESFGYIDEDVSIPGGYKLTQGALMWWLADELIRTIRDEQSFREWILDKELVGGLVKQTEIDQLQKIAKAVGNLLNEGAVSLIKAYAESFIK